MKIENKGNAPFIDYAIDTDKNKITFGDDELSFRLDKQQQDEPVVIDVFRDATGALGMGSGDYFAAEIQIPAREYTESEVEGDDGNMETVKTAKDFNIDDCTLILWGIE